MSKFILTAIFAAIVSAQSSAAIYKCATPSGDFVFTSDPVEAATKNCVQITADVKIQRVVLNASQLAEFRAKIKPGLYVWQGLIVELKAPLALVQPPRGQPRWYRIDELQPE